MKKVTFTFLLFILSINAFKSYSQQDTEFWFALPYFSLGSWHGYENRLLCIVTLDQPAEVSIFKPAVSDPSDPYYFQPIVVNVPANSFYTVNLNPWVGALMAEQGKSRPYGIQILSSTNIYAYFANAGSNYDMYSLKGMNALGNDFIVPMQYHLATIADWRTSNDARSSIEILSVDDDNDIIIETRVTTNLGPAGTYTIRLDRGYVYSLIAESITGSGHLYNTRITTKDKSKRVAVNTTDESVGDTSGGMDLIGDQIVPVELLGCKYVAIRNTSPANMEVERIYIFPTQDNTVVTVGGVSYPAMNLGDKLDVDLVQDATLITSNDDKPIVVFQITGYKPSPITDVKSLEFAGTILPKLECTGSLEVAFKTSIQDTKAYPKPLFNIITKKEYIDGFTVNDDPNIITAAAFKAVPGTNDEYYWCRYEFPAGTFDVKRLKNIKGGLFQLAVRDPYGYNGVLDNSNSYVYFSDYYTASLKARTTEDYYLEGDTLKLFLHDAGAYDNITWIAPNGTVYHDDGSGIEIYPATEADAGIYRVGAELKDLCNELDTAYVSVTIFNTDSYIQYVDMCSGSVETLRSEGYAPYVWTVLSDTLSTDRSVLVSPDVSTTYNVENRKIGVKLPFNGDFQSEKRDFVSDYKYMSPSANNLSSPGTYTMGRNAREVYSDFNTVYDHTTGNSMDGRFLIANCDTDEGQKIWTKTVDVSINTKYELSAWFITLKRNDPQARLQFVINDVVMTDLMDENNEYVPDDVIVPRNDGAGRDPADWGEYKCVWESGLRTTATISIVTAAGMTEACGVGIDDISFIPLFAVTDTIHVNVLKTPESVIISDTDKLCMGKAELDAGDNNGEDYSSYLWYRKGESTPVGSDRIYTAMEEGEYILEVISREGCMARDTINIAAGMEIEVDLVTMAEACLDEDMIYVDYEVKNSELGMYHIEYDETAKEAGFTDLTNQPVSNNELLIPLPYGIQPGIYNAEIEVFSTEVCAGSKKIPLKISVKYGANKLMAQKWNDVIALFNEDNNPDNLSYIDYQWYKNGQMLEGETKSYLYVANGQLDPTSAYSVRLTQNDGTVFYTCDFYPEIKMDIRSVPTVMEPLQKISLTGFKQGVAVLWDVHGLLYSKQQISGNAESFQAPAEKGFYVLDILEEGKNTQYKIFVR